ncbi:unnamed protein product [Parnassius mnemosyne]|uniref:Uncharacterized protein n=1 Tax=Parnassius mnemosyne TaxID=213953 RepID=A0AAV1KMU7_9NEOP
MALTPAEKQRRYRERRKKDPEKEAANKRKDLERYHAKKRLVKNLTSREHRAIKKKWRAANARRRDRAKALRVVMHTPESSPGIMTPRSRTPTPLGPNQVLPRVLPSNRRLSTPQLLTPHESSPGSTTSAAKRGRKQVKRNRTKLFRENQRLKEKIEEINKKYEKYKKRYNRGKQKGSKKESDNCKSQDKYNILAKAIKKRYEKVKSRKEKIAIQKIFEEKEVKCSRKKMQIIKECLNVDQGYIRKEKPKLRKKVISDKIKDFFNRDDVSRATAAKKETVTHKKNKMQKRYLLDSMKNLFASFKRENPDMKCSYTTFTRCRPFYVILPTVAGRETCLCRLHTNVQYLAIALCKNKVIPTSDLNKITKEQTCGENLLACMTGLCSECYLKKIEYDSTKDDLIVKYIQWERKNEIVEKLGKKYKVTKNIKEEKQSTVKSLIDVFKFQLQEFKRHVYYIKSQYRNYRACIDELSENEVALHVDFSENYSCKYFEEIQAYHFGGSRNQVSLHTGVIYLRSSDNKIEVSSFCTVSGNVTHNPAAIWAHLHPILSYIQENYTEVKIIHVFSDGPASQYRQKQNFYLICNKFFSEYNFYRVTWNFFEAGHGKGAADGVGGFLKRTADQLVARGQDIADASMFYSALKDISKIKMHFITDEDINIWSMEIPDNVLPLPGTMKVHQVFTEEKGVLKYRDLSCFCRRGFCSCMDPKEYRPLKPVDKKSSSDECEPDFMKEIGNLVHTQRKPFYNTVYGSDTDDDIPLLTVKDNFSLGQPSTSKGIDNDALIEKENIHIVKIKHDLWTILQKKFRLIETDVSYEPFENLIAIVPDPKKVYKGKRVYYQFDSPLEIFEK